MRNSEKVGRRKKNPQYSFSYSISIYMIMMFVCMRHRERKRKGTMGFSKYYMMKNKSKKNKVYDLSISHINILEKKTMQTAYH